MALYLGTVCCAGYGYLKFWRLSAPWLSGIKSRLYNLLAVDPWQVTTQLFFRFPRL